MPSDIKFQIPPIGPKTHTSYYRTIAKCWNPRILLNMLILINLGISSTMVMLYILAACSLKVLRVLSKIFSIPSDKIIQISDMIGARILFPGLEFGSTNYTRITSLCSKSVTFDRWPSHQQKPSTDVAEPRFVRSFTSL